MEGKNHGVMQSEDQSRTEGRKPPAESAHSTRYFRFDLIRVFAAALIFIFHYNLEGGSACQGSPIRPYGFGNHVNFGPLGVTLFLLLSGYLAAVSFRRFSARSDQGRVSTAFHWYLHRAWTIYPRYWVCYLVAALGSMGVFRHIGKVIILSIVGLDGYALLSGIHAFYYVGEWYIGALIMLYLMTPFLYRALCRKPRLTMILLVAWYLLFLFFYPRQFWWFANRANRPATDSDVLLRVLDFGIGMYIGMYVPKVKTAVLLPCAAAFLFAFFWNVPNAVYPLTGELSGVSSFLAFLWLGPIIETIPGQKVQRFRTVISGLAKYTYTFFLLHHVVIAGTMQAAGDRMNQPAFYWGCMLWTLFMLTVLTVAIDLGTNAAVSKIQALGKRKIDG